MTNEDFYYLFSGTNRKICDLVIRQPKVSEILMTNINVDELIEPFFAFIDLCDGITPEQMDKYKNLDLIFNDHIICMKEGCEQKSMLNAMIDTLKLLCWTNDIVYNLSNETIKVNGIEKINRDNFDELQSYILSIFYAKKPKPKKLGGSKAQQDRVREMQRISAMHRKKTGFNIPDILKVIQNGSNSFVGHDEILNLTYWQAMDRYSAIMKIDAYKTHMDYKLSMKYEMKDTDFKHWTEEIKVSV